ncbi:plasmid mobilization protein [Plantactinospora sp. WMMB334]|uniref:plasmid mobilization protein n=1 Tax=Plantactinospora sp. WMMB334 TaxID=3404119 RepID=UPI003B95161B
MTTNPPAGRRHRPHISPSRQNRLSVRLSDDEHHEIVTTAHQLGLTPTGFCAQAALDTARNLNTTAHEQIENESLARLQSELFQTRVALNQLRAELNHTRDHQGPTDDLDRTITNAAQALGNLDSIASRVHHRLRPPRSTESAS